jgi:hypothetical protein
MQKPKAKTLAAEVLKPKGSKPKGWASSREVENVSRFKEGCVLACASGAGSDSTRWSRSLLAEDESATTPESLAAFFIQRCPLSRSRPAH